MKIVINSTFRFKCFWVMFRSGTRYYCFTKDWFQPRVTTPFFFFSSPLSGRRPRTAADVKKINKINGVVQGPAVKDDCDILETWGWLKPWHLTCTVYRDSNLESFGWHWNPTFPHKECVTCAGTITLKPPWHKSTFFSWPSPSVLKS